MGYPVRQNNATKPLTFLMVLSADHITGATGVTPTVTISKNGGAFASPSGAVTEIGNGMYQLAANATDANTLGPLLLHATAASCDPRDNTFDVVDYNPGAIIPTSPPATVGSITGLTLITDALIEATIYSMGQVIRSEDADFALGKANRLIDNWNAVREAIYDETFATFTLTPSLSPHTIGPSSATFTVTQRPVSIEFCNILFNSGTDLVRVPVNLRDASWYASVTTPNMETSFPTDLYYSTDWVNGSLYFWPVPTTAYDVELVYRQVLSQITLASFLSLPPGYRDALTLTLAEDLCTPFGKSTPGLLATKAREARARIFRVNEIPPSIRTRDDGMPSAGAPETFNYRSGLFNTGSR